MIILNTRVQFIFGLGKFPFILLRDKIGDAALQQPGPEKIRKQLLNHFQLINIRAV